MNGLQKVLISQFFFQTAENNIFGNIIKYFRVTFLKLNIFAQKQYTGH